MPVRDNLPPGPGPGRPKGVPNKVTQDIADAARKLVTDPAYVAALKRRLVRGTAGALEVVLFHYAYGKPKEQHEVTGAGGGTVLFRWMTDEEAEDHAKGE